MKYLFLWLLLLPLMVFADGFGGDPGSGGGEPDDDPPPPCDCPAECPDGGPCDGGGKPVNFFTGREVHQIVDMEVKGRVSIDITRIYDSGTTYDSPLGYGWAFAFDKRLYQYPDDSVVLRVGAGQRYTYIKSGDTYVEPSGGLRGQLVENVDGSFTLKYATGKIEEYDSKGLLTAQINREGDKLEFLYSSTKKTLTGTSTQAINPDAPMTVANTYQLTKIRERLADGNLTGHYVDFTYNTTTGRLESVTSHESRTVTYTHDTYTYQGNTSTRGNLVEVENPAGIKSIYKYEDTADKHNVTWIEEGEGTTPYVNTYNSLDRVSQQTHGYDTLAFDYVIPNIQTKVTHTVKDQNGSNPVSYVTTYDFNDAGYTSKVVDPLKNKVLYFHSAKDSRLIRKEFWTNTNPNLSQNPTYNTQGIPDWTEDYKHDADGNRTYTAVGKTVYPSGSVSELLTPVGPAIVTEKTYDHGRVTEEKVYERNSNGNQVGQVFINQYTYYLDANDVPTNIKDIKTLISGTSWYTETRAYDSRGILNKVTYPDGTEKHYEYASGSLYPTKIYWKIGGTASAYLEHEYEYDSKGNLIKYWDGNNNLTQFEYDALNRRTKVTNALGEETIYSYNSTIGIMDQTENGKSGTNAGSITKLIYNNLKQLTQIQRKGTGGSFETMHAFVYDSAGRRLQITDANSHTTNYSYNGLDQLVSITNPDSYTTNYSYDLLGRRTKVTDALNRVTDHIYDDLDRLASIVEKGVTPNATTTYSYDALGHVTKVVDAEGKTTLFTYDGLGNKLTEVHPLGQTITYNYNNRNRLSQVIYPRGQKKTYEYFAWGGLNLVKTYNSSNALQRTQTYGYDTAGNVTSITDDAVQSGELMAITYDALNRPDVRTIKYLPGGNRTLDSDYNRFGVRSTLAYDESGAANDYTHSYTYDVEGKLTGASLNSQSYTLSYFNNDKLDTLTYPNGVTQAYTYLNSGPIDTITITGNSTLETFDYGYNAANNISSLADGLGTTSFTYDGQDYLTGADFPTGSGLTDETYSYDKVGNRENASNANLWQYNDNHQLTQDPDYTYIYDADGNTASRTVLGSPADPNAISATFTHDEGKRMTGYSDANTTASYLYGPTQQRLKKIVNGTTTWFLYDGAQLIAEFNSSGTVTKRYDYLPGDYAPVQMTDGNGTYAVHSDHLSTPRLMTNSSKAVVWTAKRQAFGKTIVNEDVDSNSVNVILNIRFPGQYYNSESGYSDNWNRDYNPAIGRYFQVDRLDVLSRTNDPELLMAADMGVITLPKEGELNRLYGYANQNPLIFIDPFGMANQTDHAVYSRTTNNGRYDECKETCHENCHVESMVVEVGCDWVTRRLGPVRGTAASATCVKIITWLECEWDCIKHCSKCEEEEEKKARNK